MKGGRRADFLKYYQPDPNERVYHWVEDPLQPSKDGPVSRYYMDVCLLNVQRLRDVQWCYHTSEWLNGQQAAQHFPHGMANLFAYRATDPSNMFSAQDPIGPQNDVWLERLAKDAGLS